MRMYSIGLLFSDIRVAGRPIGITDTVVTGAYTGGVQAARATGADE